jgi:Tfp pilus assembly protein PilO
MTNAPKVLSVVALILVVSILIGGYIIFTRTYPDYQLGAQQVANAATENQNLTEALASVQEFLASYENHKANSELANLTLPARNVDMANLVSSLSRIAGLSGVSLSNFQISNPSTQAVATPNSIQIQKLTLSVTGSYLSFKDFMNRLEEHQRLVDVSAIALNSTESSPVGTPILEYQISLNTYYQQ